MITARYFCKSCMVKTEKTTEATPFADFAEVTVRSRKPNEDIRSYVEEVGREIGIHHLHRGCTAKVADIALPADNEKGIGYTK